MCAPIIISAAMTVVDAAAKNKAAKANALVDERNAELARMQAGRTLAIGEIQASEAETRGRSVAASAVAAAAANNISTTSGAGAAAARAIASEAAADATRARSAAIRAAWGIESGAGQFDDRALRRRRAGALTARTELASGAARAGFQTAEFFRDRRG